MLKNNIVILLFVLLPILTFGQYTGRVFVDKNANNIYDKGERLLSGVMVSDGLNVVKTDKKGLFSLEGHDKEKFIFITTPSGYKTYNTYYRNIEQGANYDFGVISDNKNVARDGSHSFVHISDTEISEMKGHDDWITTIKQSAQSDGAAFIVHTGDICYEGGLKSHIQLMNTENMDIPMHYTIGNHDLVKGEYGEKLYEDLYGPVFYSFDVGNVHYLVLPMLHGDYKPNYTKEDVYQWLKRDLAMIEKGRPVVAFSHDLLTLEDKFIYGISDTEIIDLDSYNLKAWVYGHWHNSFMKKQGRVHSVCTSTPISGGIDHSAASFRIVSVSADGDVTSQLRYSHIKNSSEISSINSNNAVQMSNGNVLLSINTYNSASPVESAHYRYTVEGQKGSRKGKLQPSGDWNWSAILPLSGSQVGAKVDVMVESKFDNGEVISRSESFIYSSSLIDSVEPSSDWRNLLGNAEHIGISSQIISAPLNCVWLTNVGGSVFMSSPVIADGVLYVATTDENLNGEAAIHALDAKNGKQLWSYFTRNSIKNTIVVENGVVLGQDAEGYLYAIDCMSGELKWEYRFKSLSLPPLVEGIVSSNGIVYAGTRKGLTALDVVTGEVIWDDASWDGGEGTMNTLSYNNDILVSGSQWRGMYANGATDGRLLWSLKEGDVRNRASSPAFLDGMLYFISGSSIYVVEASTGNIVIRKKLPWSVDVTSTPLVSQDYIVFGTVANGIVALERETLEVQWVRKTAKTMVHTVPYMSGNISTVETSLLLSGKTLYFGSSGGEFYGVNIDSGEIIWNYPTGAPVFSTMAISGNSLYGVDFSGSVYCFISRK